MTHNQRGNAHTPVAARWQSSPQDNHPHTYPHGESSIGHTLGERKRKSNADIDKNGKKKVCFFISFAKK